MTKPKHCKFNCDHPCAKWRPHQDVQDYAVRRRQLSVTRRFAFSSALSPQLLSGDRLPKWASQELVNAFRIELEPSSFKTLAHLRERGAYLLMVTAVHPEWTSIARPWNGDQLSQATRFIRARLRLVKGARFAIGVIDASWIEGPAVPFPAHWQRHVHLVVAVFAPNASQAKKRVRTALGEGIVSSPGVSRPILIRHVDCLIGAIGYCAKTLNAGAITRRSSWMALNGQNRLRTKTRNLRLKPVQFRSLMSSLRYSHPVERIVLFRAHIEANGSVARRAR